MRKRSKCLIVANCQAPSLAKMLSLMCSDIDFDDVRVHHLRPVAIKKFVEDNANRYDIILAMKLSSNFAELEQTVIASNFPNAKTYFISNLYFSGLHPDLTYLGVLGDRCTGLLGDYHSKLALYGFMTGRTVLDTISLFTYNIYLKAGFFSEFSRSSTRLVADEGLSNIKIADAFIREIQNHQLLLSANHPTSLYFYFYSEKIAAYLAEAGHTDVFIPPWDPLLFPNLLADSVVFPIYPELSEIHKLSYPGSTYYRTHEQPGKRGRLYSLSDFIELEYKAFSEFTKEKISSSPHWNAIKNSIGLQL